MQNATREMLCKTFSSVAERADEERFPEKSLNHVTQEGERRPGTAKPFFPGPAEDKFSNDLPSEHLNCILHPQRAG
jgi:hypothetical protein